MRKWIVIFDWDNGETGERETVVVDALTEQSAIKKARKALEARYASHLPFTHYRYNVEAWDVDALSAPAILRVKE